MMLSPLKCFSHIKMLEIFVTDWEFIIPAPCIAPIITAGFTDSSGT
jgi:hypothetical protein